MTKFLVKNHNEPVLFEKNNNDLLIVSFGGIRQGLGMPVFEFNKLLKSIDCDKAFIRDFNQAWYHKGINEEVKTITELKDYLSVEILNSNYDKVCFIGNSMGAYAAILFGVLLNVDKVLAFSPQTFIDKWSRFLYKDKRWKKEIESTHNYSRTENRYFKLSKVFKGLDFNGEIDIFYALDDKLDKIHSEKLKKQKSVRLFSKQKGGHSIIKDLRDEGELIEIIRSLLV